MSEMITIIKETLERRSDMSTDKVSMFFKKGPGDYAESDKFIGVSVPTLRQIAERFKNISLSEIGFFLNSAINQERQLALFILIKQYEKASKECQQLIFDFYLSNKKNINNWNLVDSSAHLIIGAHLYERERDILKQMAISSNLWERRISIIATLYFIKKGDLDDTFAIADMLLSDSHDLIHKAVGWMLREAGKKNEERLRDYLYHRAAIMPRTMLRYATERLNKEQRSLLMTIKAAKN